MQRGRVAWFAVQGLPVWPALPSFLASHPGMLLPTFSPPRPPKPWSKRHVNRVETPELFGPKLGRGNDELVENVKEKILTNGPARTSKRP